MRFRDRVDAGQRLAEKLIHYKDNPDVIVLGLPRGGIVVAFEVAAVLKVPLDVIVVRKIGAPGHPELAVGALTQDGLPVLNRDLMQSLNLSELDIATIIEEERKELQRRLTTYRGDCAQLDLRNKIAIIVDDGIATGATIKAAIISARNLGSGKIIVAIPVAASDSLNHIKPMVDGVVCLYTPEIMSALGAFYDTFDQIEDQTVIRLLGRM